MKNSSKNSVNDIRNAFLGYFTERGHTEVASSSLLPRNDPTLLFINAGMNQFKDLFTGKETREYTRATTSQKCVRAGGKHNDLDNVGYTARHHTFFEMLGNFSFGDYFKDEAIDFAWELLTKDFGLSPEKMLVTVHSSDEEAAAIWKKVTGFSDDKIIRIPTSDNFWSMGDTGPCGPCTEIFYDHGADIPGGVPGSPDQDGDRFTEIWNNVFMQFEQMPDGSRVDLPKPCVDTGMGLERLAAILQGKHDNYDIDLMRSLILESAELTGVEPDGEFKTSHRVIADHLRSSAFLIADGVLPSNEGRGYVLRRIMRRAMRHAHMMGCDDPVMYKMLPALIKQMGGHYGELITAEKLIVETLKNEETRFKKTVDRGLHLLKEETGKLGETEALPGDVAFKLFDTYGFPLDLTEDVLREEGRPVDVAGFNAAMEEQRTRARKSWVGSGDAATDKIWFDLADEHGKTEFLGYSTENAVGDVIALIQDGKEVEGVKKGEECILLTNQTPFYAESGGQLGDKGFLSTQEGTVEITVTDTQKKRDVLHAHICKVTKGTLTKGMALDMLVNGERRAATQANHSATHLLHAALRLHLGEHVTQKGSLVSAERLRFDFAHPGALSADDMAYIEKQVNDHIRANTPVSTRLMDKDEAVTTGAMALFGEKYDEEVRVVSMGGAAEESAKEYSVELCGGTHVKRTGDIGLFKITGTSAIGANIKRIEAVTGAGALGYVSGQEAVLGKLESLLSVKAEGLSSRVETLLSERRDLERHVDELRRQIAMGGGAGSNDDTKEINGIAVISKIVADLPAKNMRAIADELSQKLGSGIVTLVGVNDGKAALVITVSDDLTDRINAVDLVRAGVTPLGGKGGGGRPDFAQAGGPDGQHADKAIEAVEALIA